MSHKERNMFINLVIFICLISTVLSDHNYTLEKVIIVSRHGVRTALTRNMESYTQNRIHRWKEQRGHLTKRGENLESFMGDYFHQWLQSERLFQHDCPMEKEIFVYANNVQRTSATAKSFLKNAFPNCSVAINAPDRKKESIFSTRLHNNSYTFLKMAQSEMKDRLKKLSKKHLGSSLRDLEVILNFKKSKICLKLKKCCNLKDVRQNQIIKVNVGRKPGLLGPLEIANSAVDAFIMEFYENHSSSKEYSEKQWDSISNIQKGYFSVVYAPLVASDMAGPLINYLKDLFLYDNRKLTLIVGHDSNLYCILSGLKFKTYFLPNQFEQVPVGGKIVFEKWYDLEHDRYLLKIRYVYQSSEQLRNLDRLSLKYPPFNVTLELEECRINEEGFCLWNDFEDLLHKIRSNVKRP